MNIKKLIREWRSLRAFKSWPRSQRNIVIYSEGPGYWTYFEPIFRALRNEFSLRVLYVTSSENDPVYQSPPEGLHPFLVGKGAIRTLFFATLDVDVLLMTMPDLQSFHIKRSPHRVHYSYVHHSIVSTHMVYRPEAFDHFDSLLCVGPHHIEETRTREATLSLKAKALIEHGYSRLDQIIANSRPGPLQRDDNSNLKVKGQVLIAPSWGTNSLLEQHGSDAVKPLLDEGFRVVLRPHPQTIRQTPSVIDNIVNEHGNNPLFSLDMDGDAHSSLSSSDIMVSDWSGAALEFALGLERPVIFIDVPRKVLNPDYTSLGIEPLEAKIRREIGVIVSPADLSSLGAHARSLMRNAGQWQTAARAARDRWVFNIGSSGRVAAEFLCSLTPPKLNP